MASHDRSGNAYGSPAKAKTNAERAGRVPSQQESDQHTIAHADGFSGPRISETYGQTHPMSPKNIVPYTTKDGEKRMQLDPGFDTGKKTADRMKHLDRVYSGPSKTKMFQHKGTGTIVEQMPNYKGEYETNEFGSAGSGAAVHVRRDESLSGKAHIRGVGNNLDPEEYTDISPTIRGTETYKTSRGENY